MAGLARPTVVPKGFLELCCDAESTFGRLCEERGRPCLRVTETVGLHTSRGLGRALGFLAEHPASDVWAATPCTPWTSWCHLNAAKLGEKFRSRLAYRRRASLRLVNAAAKCMATAQASGGHCHFEWPRYASGWKRRPVQRMLKQLGMETADFDGCAFGVSASPTVLALKPWRVATTHPGLAAALRRFRCPGDHEHGTLSGAWAYHSGFCPESLCNLVLDELDSRAPPLCRPRRHGLRTYS